MMINMDMSSLFTNHVGPSRPLPTIKSTIHEDRQTPQFLKAPSIPPHKSSYGETAKKVNVNNQSHYITYDLKNQETVRIVFGDGSLLVGTFFDSAA